MVRPESGKGNSKLGRPVMSHQRGDWDRRQETTTRRRRRGEESDDATRRE
jgi:hypothetical protein